MQNQLGNWKQLPQMGADQKKKKKILDLRKANSQEEATMFSLLGSLASVFKK